jgi:hypothetical protein
MLCAMVIHFGFVRVLRGLLARVMRRTLRGTGWKPVFHDRLEAYLPLPLRLPPRALRFVSFASRWRGTGETPVLQHSRDGYAPIPIPLRLPPRALRLCVSLPVASRWRGTGWKPVFHDRLEAYLPSDFPLETFAPWR